MLRNIIGIAVGIAAAVAVVAIGEGIGHSLFPPPTGTDLADPEALRTLIASLPMGAIVAVLVSWAAGAFTGGGVAAWIGGRMWPALVVGLVMLAAGAYTMTRIPHPLWFQIASVPAALLPAGLVGLLFGRRAARANA